MVAKLKNVRWGVTTFFLLTFFRGGGNKGNGVRINWEGELEKTFEEENFF